MIRDLLEATRVDSGKLRIDHRCVDIGNWFARQWR
jgi:hypothetical protein